MPHFLPPAKSLHGPLHRPSRPIHIKGPSPQPPLRLAQTLPSPADHRSTTSPPPPHVQWMGRPQLIPNALFQIGQTARSISVAAFSSTSYSLLRWCGMVFFSCIVVGCCEGGGQCRCWDRGRCRCRCRCRDRNPCWEGCISFQPPKCHPRWGFPTRQSRA